MVISQLVPFARAAGLNAKTATHSPLQSAPSAKRVGEIFLWLDVRSFRAPVYFANGYRDLNARHADALYLAWGDTRVLRAVVLRLQYCYGTQISVYTALAGDFWGTKYLATNYGVLLLAWGFAGVMGPVLGSHVFVSTGTYQYAFFGSAGHNLRGARNPEFCSHAAARGNCADSRYGGRDIILLLSCERHI